MTNPCCGLAVIFCGFISHLIGRETINIPEIFSGVHGFTGTTVKIIAFVGPLPLRISKNPWICLIIFVLFSFSGISLLVKLTIIGPLHDPITWYKITHAGEQVAQWDFQNKGRSRWTGTSCFVLEVPLCNLLTSMCDFVPCDRIMQRVY